MKRFFGLVTAVAFLSLYPAAPVRFQDSAAAQGFPTSKVRTCLSFYECFCVNVTCSLIDFPENSCCCWSCPE
jgi:hypothetical protein